MTRLSIDIWSDVMCPWCLVGWGQLSRALAELEGEIEAEVRWRPFELNPDMPAEGTDQQAYLRHKSGRSEAELREMRERIRAIAREAGVSIDYAGEGEAPPAMMWNTFAAHKLLAWTLDNEGPAKQTELKLALFSAHFNERRRIGERPVLLDVVDECGLDRAAAAAALDDEVLAARVRAEEREALDLNITGVPAMVVEGRFLIPGAQQPETYVTALRRVAERSQR